MIDEENPPSHPEISQLNSELDMEKPIDGERFPHPSSKLTHPETALENEELKQTSLLLYEAPALQTCLTIEETTNVDSIQNLRNEFTFKKMWTDRSLSRILLHFITALFFGIVGSSYDVATDILLFEDYWCGKLYKKTVASPKDVSVNSSDCFQIGFYSELINGTTLTVTSYTFTCFEQDPYYALATLTFILLPGLWVYMAFPADFNK
jgi:hypothetical protein